MTESLVLFGSTGSIGLQTLSVAEELGLCVRALAAHRSVALLEEQARRFNPELAVLSDPHAAQDLRVRLADTSVRVLGGDEALLEAASLEADTAVCAMVGLSGLKPTLHAIESGKKIALANKETLVCAGELMMNTVYRRHVELLPVDSEHSAILQCLQGTQNPIHQILLTASGGPFYGWRRDALRTVTPEMALRHPNWNMGAKITIDSATLMNKGLELIEAVHLFGVEPDKITVIVQRESVIHSCVEFVDGAILAQLGSPDMRVPIQYALTYPERRSCPAKRLDFTALTSLQFGLPDENAFGCLRLAKEAIKIGGTACAALSGANETAVARFLAGEIEFLDIERINEKALSSVERFDAMCLDNILEADRQAREIAALE